MASRSEILTQAIRLMKQIDPDLLHMRTFAETTDCGTAHCLLGWMAVDPWFQQNTPILQHMLPTGVDLLHSSSFTKVSESLGLTELEGKLLFAFHALRTMDPHAITRGDVLRRLRKLLRNEPIKPYKPLRYLKPHLLAD